MRMSLSNWPVSAVKTLLSFGRFGVRFLGPSNRTQFFFSELCCPGAKPRRWTAPLTSTYYCEYNEDLTSVYSTNYSQKVCFVIEIQSNQ